MSKEDRLHRKTTESGHRHLRRERQRAREAAQGPDAPEALIDVEALVAPIAVDNVEGENEGDADLDGLWLPSVCSHE